MLSQNQIKNTILSYVAANPGCSVFELATKSGVIQDDFALDIPDMIEQWVDNNELIEVEYVIQSLNHRTKYIYFPSGKYVFSVKTKHGIDIMVDSKKNRDFPRGTEVIIRGK